jgi:hypothetical protein
MKDKIVHGTQLMQLISSEHKDDTTVIENKPNETSEPDKKDYKETKASDNEYEELEISFPSTIILAITTHGKIHLKDDYNPQSFIVPEGMKIIRSLMSSIGECNILNERDVNKQINIIKKNMKKLLKPKDQLDTVVSVTGKIRKIDLDNLHYKETKVKELGKIKIDDMDFDEYETQQMYKVYIHSLDKAHIINIKYSGDNILNKSYDRLDEEPTSNDWVIKVVNMPGQPDILTYLLKLKSDETSTITFEDIVLFLKSKMVETLIVFDFSCSDIIDKDGEMSPSERTVRKVRTSMTSYDPKTKKSKLTLGGKKRKSKRTMKRKSNRTMKR